MTSDPRVHARGGARDQILVYVQKVVFLCWSNHFREHSYLDQRYPSRAQVGPYPTPQSYTCSPTLPIPYITYPSPTLRLSYSTLPSYSTFPTPPYLSVLRIHAHANDQTSCSPATLSCDNSYSYCSHSIKRTVCLFVSKLLSNAQ